MWLKVDCSAEIPELVWGQVSVRMVKSQASVAECYTEGNNLQALQGRAIRKAP